MFKKLLSIVLPDNSQDRSAQAYRDVIRHFARVGGTLFGPVADGSRREFFCLDEHTWIWHEEWTDANNTRHARTTRYDVRPHGIFKAQDGQPYQPLSAEEIRRLYTAAYQYDQNVQAVAATVVA